MITRGYMYDYKGLHVGLQRVTCMITRGYMYCIITRVPCMITRGYM